MKQHSDEVRPGPTHIHFSEDARTRLLRGMKMAADTVGCTLGPCGMTVLIAQGDGPAIATKDGVTVSRSIRLKDPVERMGADLIREAASRTNDVAGDGTTTATVLTHAMTAESNRLMTAGFAPVELKRGIERAADVVIAALRIGARAVGGKGEIAQVGTVSANGDAHVGSLIAEAMEKVGRDGVITVEDAKGTTTSLDVVKGMRFDRGYLSPYFVTNNERMNAVHDDGYVLLTDGKLSDMQELLPLLEAVLKEQRSLLIVADEVEGQALQTLIVNRLNAQLRVVAIKAPGYGSSRDAFLQDIAVLTGGRVLGAASGLTLAKARLADLGRCKRFVVDARTTTIVGTGTTAEAVGTRVDELRAQLADPTLSAQESDRLCSRVARLASGVAVIRVGGATELEMIERKHRIEDALNATRAAVEEGIVPGGGTALAVASWAAALQLADVQLTKGERAGADLVLRACEAPLRRIVENAGASADVVLARLRTEPGMGFNAATAVYQDLIEAGILDPVKVSRVALQNAASVAATFTTLSAVVVAVE